MEKVDLQANGDQGVRLSAETEFSHLAVDLFCRQHVTSAGQVFSGTVAQEDRGIGHRYEIDAEAGASYTLEKLVWLDTRLAAETVPDQSKVMVELDTTYQEVAKDSAAAWAEFWEESDITVEGDVAVQQGLRFSLAHLRQAYRAGPAYGLGAKGLTSESYGLAHFWDSESYMLPFYLHTQPELARQILMFRYNNLDQARARAKRLGNQGAMYAFMTIQGEDNPAAWACIFGEQFINASVPYAIWNYVWVTGDVEWLVQYGAEMVIENARFWEGRTRFNPQIGRYVINQVTGVDEYSEWVNNNFYTNAMAAWALGYACQVVERLKKEYPTEWARLAERLDYAADESAQWFKISDKMYLAYDEVREIHEQHDGFFGLDEVDLAQLPASEFPLEEHWPWPKVLQHNALKQPDVLLAEFMLSEHFSKEQKKRDYEHYEPLTTHDSSLSPSIHSIIAAEVGLADQAWKYLHQSCRLDLDYDKASQGVHLANAGGAWMTMVHGLAGYRLGADGLSFSPAIFQGWKAYSFKLKIHGGILQVHVTEQQTEFVRLSGAPIELKINEKKQRLEHKIKTQTRILKPILPPAASGKPVSAVLFDLDGVIVSTDEYHYKAWKRMADEEEIFFNREINERLRGVSRNESLEIILERTSKAYDTAEKTAMATTKNDYYLHLLEDISPSDILPGGCDLIDHLKERDIKIAIASSSRNAPVILERIGLSDAFDAIADGNDISASKPDPEVFLLAAERVGCSPVGSLVIEDADAGVEAAHAGGMRCLAVGAAADNKLATAHALDLSEITPSMLLSIGRRQAPCAVNESV